MLRLALVLFLAFSWPAAAQPADDILAAVVKVEVKVPPNARSASTLGTERRGHGVVIGKDGLIVTIGYLVQEASEIDVTRSNTRLKPRTNRVIGLRLVSWPWTGFRIRTESTGVSVRAMKPDSTIDEAIVTENWR